VLRSNNMARAVGKAFSSTYSRLEKAAIAAARRNDAMLLYVPDNLAGVYQDSAGATSPAVGAPIGLVLDRQYGLSPASAELITNGSFAGSTGWTSTAFTTGTITTTGGAAVFSGVGGGSVLSNSATVQAGRAYRLTYEVKNYVTGAFRAESTSGGYTGLSRASNGVFSEIIRPTGSSVLSIKAVSATTGDVDNVSLVEVLGYHATQPTAASKPTLSRIPRKRGPELVINGGFDSSASWSTISTTISGGSVALAVQFAYAQQTIELKAGASYVVSYSVIASSGSYPLALSGSGFTGVTTTIPAVVGRNSVVVACVNTSNLLKLIAPNTGTSVTIDDVSVREVLEWSNVLSFDGIDDFLDVTFRDYYAAGGSTCAASWFGSVSANTGFVIAETSLVSNTPLLSPLGIASGASNAGFFMRDDAGAQPHNFTNYSPGGFADTNVVGVVDSGSNIKGYTRGIKTYDTNYSRGGAITASKITVGATQRTGNSNWVKIPIALICWSANVMPDADRKAIERFASYLVGEPYV
jgi:hypothetical protein